MTPKTKTIPIPLLPVGEAPELLGTHTRKLFPDQKSPWPMIYVEQLTQATDAADGDGDPPFFMGRVRGPFGGLLDEVHGAGVADVLFHARRRFIQR